MLKNQIESVDVRNWVYERSVFKSSILDKEFHCGFFRSKAKKPITKTIYIFHGGDSDDSQVAQAGLLPHLSEILDHHSAENTQIVFPFIGASFLHDHPIIKKNSFSEYFLKELIPACEMGHQILSQNRLLCGWSMGGQAALNMFLRFPEKFGGVGVHFPTLIDFNYNDKKQQEAYALRQKVSETMMKILVTEFQREFVDMSDFAKHDPLQLAKQKSEHLDSKKKIYFDVGEEDEFGLSEGAKSLHDILADKKIAHHFELVPQGKHDGAFIYGQISKMLKYIL